MIPLQHEANAAVAAIENAKTPAQKFEARRAGLAVHADLEKQLGDENFKTAFKAAKPQSMVGVWKGGPVFDRPVFLTGPNGTRIIAPVKLPNGAMAAPNPQNQICVPASMLPQMLALGFLRVNDNAFTSRADGMGNADPTRSNEA